MIIAANWKMNMGCGQAQNFLSRFKQLVRPGPQSGPSLRPQARDFVFFPPAFLAGLFQGGAWLWGGQNVHSEPKGAWTGENSAQSLKEMGAGFCLVGHSERRRVFGESDQDVEAKFQVLQKTGLVPFLCVGEGLEDRSRKQDILKRQLGFLKQAQDKGNFSHTIEAGERRERQEDSFSRSLTKSAKDIKTPFSDANRKLFPSPGFVVAYEPVWAVGSGKTPSFQEIGESLQGIKEHLGLPGLKTLYGGSVNKDLAGGLAGACPAVDGFLIGGASLDPDSLYEIGLSSRDAGA